MLMAIMRTILHTHDIHREPGETLAAAGRVFHARGYADASIQHVADELGLLKGSLYHYIASKEELLYRLLEETHEGVSRILDEVKAQEGLAPLEHVRLYVRRQVAYSLAHPERIAIYHRDLERLCDERRAAMVSSPDRASEAHRSASSRSARRRRVISSPFVATR